MCRVANDLNGYSYKVAVTYVKFMSYTEIHEITFTYSGPKLLSLDCAFRMSNFVNNEQPFILPNEDSFKLLLKSNNEKIEVL